MLSLIAARWQLGIIDGDEIPRLATELMLAGHDNQQLRELAGQRTATLRDDGAHFATALALSGAPTMAEADAATLIGLASAEAIATGAAPYPTASKAGSLWYRFTDDNVLGMFYSLADSWEESPENRAELEAEIREYAVQVTAGGEPHAS